MEREQEQSLEVLRVMVGLYCRNKHGDKHGTDSLCEDCSALLKYGQDRIISCPYGLSKPPCSLCHTHCYKPVMRDKVRMVMRYAGPRMIWSHPIMALVHAWQVIRWKLFKGCDR